MESQVFDDGILRDLHTIVVGQHWTSMKEALGFTGNAEFLVWLLDVAQVMARSPVATGGKSRSSGGTLMVTTAVQTQETHSAKRAAMSSIVGHESVRHSNANLKNTGSGYHLTESSMVSSHILPANGQINLGVQSGPVRQSEPRARAHAFRVDENFPEIRLADVTVKQELSVIPGDDQSFHLEPDVTVDHDQTAPIHNVPVQCLLCQHMCSSNLQLDEHLSRVHGISSAGILPQSSSTSHASATSPMDFGTGTLDGMASFIPGQLAHDGISRDKGQYTARTHGLGSGRRESQLKGMRFKRPWERVTCFETRELAELAIGRDTWAKHFHNQTRDGMKKYYYCKKKASNAHPCTAELYMHCHLDGTASIYRTVHGLSHN